MTYDLLADVKLNLVLEHDEDDYILQQYIDSAVNYAEKYQHIPEGTYHYVEMSPTTRQAVIMLASHFYEARDGSTGGFFGDSVAAAKQAMEAINNLLVLDKEWTV